MVNRRHKNIRMPMWDYSQPAVYMVTICTHGRTNHFGDISPENIVEHTFAGKMVTEEIGELPNRYPQVDVDTFVVMPNHIHVLRGLNLDFRRSKLVSLGSVVGALKSTTTVRYIRGVKLGYLPPFHTRLWQSGYYETVMRSGRMADEYRDYIVNNPAAWEDDLEINFASESPTRGDATS